MTFEVAEHLYRNCREKFSHLTEGVPSLSEKDKTAGMVILTVGSFYFFPYTTIGAITMGWYADKKIENLKNAFINFWNSSSVAKAFLISAGTIAIYSRNAFIPIGIGLYVGMVFSPLVEKAHVLYEKVITQSPQKKH